MALTKEQVRDLNRMNKASQNVQLGTLLEHNTEAGYKLPEATKEAIGGVKQAKLVAEASSSTVSKAEFKALLDALKEAGIMAKA